MRAIWSNVRLQKGVWKCALFLGEKKRFEKILKKNSSLVRNFHLARSFFFYGTQNLVLRLLLAVGEESPETSVGDLDDLETNAGNISLGLTLTTETRDEDLVVLVDVCEGTVPRDEGSDLLTVLDKLHSDSLTNGRVRLLSLDTETLNNNTLSVRSTTKRIGLQGSTEVSLLEILIVPALHSAVSRQLASSLKTRWFTLFFITHCKQNTHILRQFSPSSSKFTLFILSTTLRFFHLDILLLSLYYSDYSRGL